jgi:hypothetical protein
VGTHHHKPRGHLPARVRRPRARLCLRKRGWTGTSGEFCRREGISRSSLLRWAKRLRVPVTARSRPGTGLMRDWAKPEADRSPFAAVRIRPVPGTDAALRVVLPNGTRLEVPERDPAVLRLVVETVSAGTSKPASQWRPKTSQGIAADKGGCQIFL